MISCWIDKIDGRKVYLRAKLVDKDGNVYTEATALFIKVQWGVANWKFIKSKLNSVAQDNAQNKQSKE